MFDAQRWGRAWCCYPKPTRRSWLRSNRRMPSCDAEPVSASGAPGGHCRAEANCFGETPERRLWVYQCVARRAAFARRSLLTPNPVAWDQPRALDSSTTCHRAGPGRSKKPSIQSLLPPRLWSFRAGLPTGFGANGAALGPHSLTSAYIPSNRTRSAPFKWSSMRTLLPRIPAFTSVRAI